MDPDERPGPPAPAAAPPVTSAKFGIPATVAVGEGPRPTVMTPVDVEEGPHPPGLCERMLPATCEALVVFCIAGKKEKVPRQSFLRLYTWADPDRQMRRSCQRALGEMFVERRSTSPPEHVTGSKHFISNSTP